MFWQAVAVEPIDFVRKGKVMNDRANLSIVYSGTIMVGYAMEEAEGRWRAHARLERRLKDLGTFPSLQEARESILGPGMGYPGINDIVRDSGDHELVEAAVELAEMRLAASRSTVESFLRSRGYAKSIQPQDDYFKHGRDVLSRYAHLRDKIILNS